IEPRSELDNANPPDQQDDEVSFAGVLALRSMADPSLVVDAATLWDAPDAVLSRLGEQVEAQLLIGLRRAARALPPLRRALEAAAPGELSLADDEIVELLSRDPLRGAGVEVLWPKGMFAEAVHVRASATPAPGSEGGTVFRLTDLLKFRWQLSLGGETLT